MASRERQGLQKLVQAMVCLFATGVGAKPTLPPDLAADSRQRWRRTGSTPSRSVSVAGLLLGL